MLRTLLAFTAAAVLIILLPGPDTLLVLRSMLRGGRREAALTAAGIMTGLCVWVLAAAFGLAALLRASETGYTVLKYVGGAYLVWLGVQSLRTRLSPAASAPALPPGSPRRRGLIGTGYGAGLATNLLNPKVGVFFVTFFPGFIPAGESVVAVSLMLGAIFLVLSVIYFVLLLAIAGRLIAWMNNPRVRRRLDRATGVVLIGFGVRLATEP